MTALAIRSPGLLADFDPPSRRTRDRVQVRLERAQAAPTSAFGAAEPQRWLTLVEARLNELLRLQANWDGFGAGPVRTDVVQFALQLLSQVLEPDRRAPQIVPLPNGGIQLEWHFAAIDLEIEIKEPNKVWASLEERRQEPSELELRSDFAKLAPWTRKLPR